MNLDLSNYHGRTFIIIIMVIGVLGVKLSNLAMGDFTISPFVGLTPAIIFTGCLEKWLWKYRPFSWLCKIPNISGRYEGIIEFEYKGIHDSKAVAYEIFQTCSSLIIRAYFDFSDDRVEETESGTKMHKISSNGNDTWKLYHLYENEGQPSSTDITIHEGTEVLTFSRTNGTWSLKGHYYTNRKPNQTRGKITATLIQSKLKHKKCKGTENER